MTQNKKPEKERDGLSWDDIILNKAVKETLNDFCANDLLSSRSYLEWGCRPPKGVLLYGPPGTGKSLALKIIGSLTPFPFFPIDVSTVGSMYVNESANKLDRYFKRVATIASHKGAALICFDEIDGLLMPRGDSYSHAEDHKVVTTFTKHMEGIANCQGVYVMAATNMELSQLDAAVIRAGRFDFKFYVGLPDEESRAAIFRLHLEKKQEIAKNAGNPLFMQNMDYNTLAMKTPEYSGADINAIINSICNKKRRETAATRARNPITMDELLETIAFYNSTTQRGKKELGFKA